jgi:hypothetical protein
MVVRRHRDLVGIPGPMQYEAGSKLGELSSNTTPLSFVVNHG